MKKAKSAVASRMKHGRIDRVEYRERRRIMVFGTFDLLHPGHINFLKRAVRYGNFLVIVVARDKTVLSVKGHLPDIGEYDRVYNLAKLNIADKIVLGNLRGKYNVIRREKPDIICLGYDQKNFIDKLADKVKEFGLKTKIIRLKPYHPDKYKSSKMRR